MIDRVSSSPRAAATKPPADDRRAALIAAAQAFEAVFMRQVIGSMRQASLGEDLLGSSATEQFREMSDARLADQMAATRSFGIAEMLLKQFGVPATGKAGGTGK
jgi:flagellar protein FlgJ